MSLPSSSFETLDEPVSATILRDFRMVAGKMKEVLNFWGSAGSQQQITQGLHNWDLWGPLILCLTLASSLSFSAPDSQTALVFASVFVLVWCGAGVVTLNGSLLGGQMSFLQSVCVLGYCLCPLVLASLICHFARGIVLDFIIVAVAFAWSCRAGLLFLQPLLSVGNPSYTDRRALAVYPLALFYATISWMILVQ